jgi:oligopeptide transport system permease protein
MLTYALRRFLILIPTLFVIITASFFFVRLIPGGPFDMEKALPPEIEKNLRERYHLNESKGMQYLRYLGLMQNKPKLDADGKKLPVEPTGLLHGDLGLSTKIKNRSINEILREPFKTSMALAVLSLAFGLLVGIPIGIYGAIRRNTVGDYFTSVLVTIGVAMPAFILAPALIIIFCFRLHWLPVAGWGGLREAILPVVCLGALRATYVARLMRGSMLEALSQDFIRTARAKGVAGWLVIFRHALPVALTPIVSYLGPALAGNLEGGVVIEKIFFVPGMGQFFLSSAQNRDLTMAIACVIIYSVVLLSLNFVVDLIYPILDPRVELK